MKHPANRSVRQLAIRIAKAKKLLHDGYQSVPSKIVKGIKNLDKIYLDISRGNFDALNHESICKYIKEIIGQLKVAFCTLNGINTSALKPDFRDPPKKTLLFLRSLYSSRRYLLPDFSNIIAKKLYDHPIITGQIHLWPLETLLYCSLYRNYSSLVIGGVYEVFGMGRAFSFDNDWKKIVDISMGYADCLLLLPDTSEGIRWEITHIVEKDLLNKLIVIMLPNPTELLPKMGKGIPGIEEFYNVEASWEKCVLLYQENGLQLPQYSATGGIIRFRKDGSVSTFHSIEPLLYGTFIHLLEK